MCVLYLNHPILTRFCRGRRVSAELPVVLREAHGIVAEQLSRLRSLAESTRREGERLSGALRQSERLLDEVGMQHRLAVQRGTAAAGDLGRRLAELRAQHDALLRETN